MSWKTNYFHWDPTCKECIEINKEEFWPLCCDLHHEWPMENWSA